MEIALCLLTRNELPCLREIFPKIPKPGKNAGFNQVWAIDGGSTDGTLDYYRKNKISVISQKNKGRGDAFLEAFRKIDVDAYIFFFSRWK